MGKSTINHHFQQLCEITRGYCTIYLDVHWVQGLDSELEINGQFQATNIIFLKFYGSTRHSHLKSQIISDPPKKLGRLAVKSLQEFS